MPRQKEVKKPKFLYSEESMKQALAAVRSGVNVMEASRQFGVPRSTLIYKSSGKSPVERKMGPGTVLPEKYEALLENWIKEMAKRGFPIVKWDLLSSVEKIVRELGIQHPFSNGKPGKKWLNLFLNRHPSIAKRVVEKLTTSRASVTEHNLRNWFRETKSLLAEEGLFDILEDPTRVFNTDESAFMLCPKSEKVLGIRGQRNVYEVSGANDKESLTVLITANASGVVGPTLIVFPYVRLPAEIAKTVPAEWAIGKSEKGWMNAENFYEYITNSFHPWLVSSGIQLPVVLFLDGHSSHLTLHLSKFCSENGIIVVSLYPNATHIIQPLDVSVFRPLKLGWQKTVHSWKMQNIHQHLTKYNFAPLLEQTITNYLSKDALINGFRLCGLHPFSEDAVDYSKCANFISENKTDSIQNTTSMQTESHLVYLENKMRPETISAFKSFFEENKMKKWTGENEELYDLWKSFKMDHQSTSLSKGEVQNMPSFIEPTPSTSRTLNDDRNITENEMEEIENSPRRCTSVTASITYDSTPPPQPDVPKQIRQSTGTKLAKMISPQTNGEGVPTPFKRVLFWPGTPPKKKRKDSKAVKIPSVVSSKAWQQYFEKKKAEKDEKERKIQERRAEREQKKLKKVQLKTKKDSFSESESGDSSDVPLAESDNETLQEVMERYRNEEEAEEELLNESTTTPQVGKWALVQLLTEKNKRQHYVGQIIAIKNNVSTVKFLKKKVDCFKFVWPDSDDISDVGESSILKILPEPNLGRRCELSFNITFAGYNLV